MEFIAAISAAITAVREASKLAEKTNDLEIQKLLIDATQQILNVQIKAQDFQQQNINLKNENMELLAKLNKKSQFVFEKNAFWELIGETKEGPYCVTCHAKGISSRLTLEQSVFPGSPKRYYCGICQEFANVG